MSFLKNKLLSNNDVRSSELAKSNRVERIQKRELSNKYESLMNFTVQIRILRIVLLFSPGPKKLAVFYGNCCKKESCIYLDPVCSIPL